MVDKEPICAFCSTFIHFCSLKLKNRWVVGVARGFSWLGVKSCGMGWGGGWGGVVCVEVGGRWGVWLEGRVWEVVGGWGSKRELGTDRR